MRILSGWWAEHEHPVSHEKASALARAACRERGMTWLEPTIVTEAFTAWVIWSNGTTRGENLRVVVSKRTGRVRDISER